MSQPFVLLFGMPRSGTTWVGKILDSHPGTVYRHEPDAGGTLNHVPWVIGREHPRSVGDALRGFAAGLLDVNTKARRGGRKGFTGIDDPYEAPARPDLVLSTMDTSPEACAETVLALLADRGFVGGAA